MMTAGAIAITILCCWGVIALAVNVETALRRRKARGESRRAEKLIQAIPPDTKLLFGGGATVQDAANAFARIGAMAGGRISMQQPPKERPPDHFGYTKDDSHRPTTDELLDHDPLLEEFEKLEQEIAEREHRDAQRKSEEVMAGLRREASGQNAKAGAAIEAEVAEIRAMRETCEHKNLRALKSYVAVPVSHGSELYKAGYRHVGATHQCDGCLRLHFECMGMTWPV